MAIRGIGSRDFHGIDLDEGVDLFLSALVRGTDENKAVMASAEDTVVLVTTNNNFCGVVRAIDQKNKNASVQMEGWAELTYDGSDPSPQYGYMHLVGGATAGNIKKATEGEIKEVSVTVAASATSGASSADATLVGGTVVGAPKPASNQDQLVDNVTVGVDGSVTVTLAAAATADNTFKVSILKAEGFRPKKYFVSGVDTTNKIMTVRID